MVDQRLRWLIYGFRRSRYRDNAWSDTETQKIMFPTNIVVSLGRADRRPRETDHRLYSGMI